MKILCENCGVHFEKDIGDGDEGCTLTCPNCGQKGMLYVSLVPEDGGDT